MPLAHEVRPAAPGARVRLPARLAELGEHLRAQKPYEPPPLVDAQPPRLLQYHARHPASPFDVFSR
ncbi:hypothetical protein ADJ70_04275 [Olsenella sp. oral taxon 807]|nr:hypothetical protein ADJ70_02775 [Olsenella sp. oral taxon 807]AKT48353.1 hypothetical protein ADJ70_04275 [Olsenella sp. oral taxon 807]